MKKEIYLDYNATTPCDQRVLEKMLPFFTEYYGNPSNGFHKQGRITARYVEVAREQIAALIGANQKEIIFTAGATESNNLAIFGITRSGSNNGRNRIVTSAIEHKSVLNPCHKLQEEGYEVIYLPVDSQGCVDLDAAKEAINANTLLVSVQFANNEIGSIQPIKEISEIAHDRGALLHCDAAQAAGKVKLDVHDLGVDLLSVSAHKLYGPKGIGALFIAGGVKSIRLEPLIYGGGHESGVRSGTQNVPSIVGFGEACRIVAESLDEESSRIKTLRDELEARLIARIPNMYINGQKGYRLPNTSSMTFPGIDADALLFSLPDVMMGNGSACNSGAIEPSHVLQAIGVNREDAYSTIRASLGRFTTSEDILEASEKIAQAVENLQSIS